MRTFALSLALLLSVGAIAFCAAAEDDSPLPFSVKIGGLEAKAEKDFGKLSDAVAPDAEMELGVKNKAMIICNFFPSDEKGAPREGAAPAILIIQNDTKTKLSKTMDGKPLAAGNYRVNIVGDGKTAMLIIKIK